ncbi:MAG TPA: hypothetical protein VIE65_18055, partial [Methylobacter sp.]
MPDIHNYVAEQILIEGKCIMSRWVDQFENHAFQSEWIKLKEALDEATLDDKTITTSVTELARLKKVISYLDGMIKSIDPEL